MQQKFLIVTVLAVCAGLPAQEYQLNSVESSLTLDGVVATATSAAVSSYCPGGSVTAVVNSTNVGLGWEVAVAEAALIPVSAGAYVSCHGQIVNLDLGAPVVWYYNGGSSAAYTTPLPAQTQTFNFGATNVLSSAGIQIGVQSPTHPDGVSVSQACQLDVIASGVVPTSVLNGDDVSLSISAGPGSCLPVANFFGTAYTSLHISSNGRIVFGAPNIDFSPSLGEAMSGDGFFGFWTDFNPVLGGSLVIDSFGLSQVRATWSSVPFYAEPGTANSFSLIYDLNSGVCAIDGLQGIVANPVNNTTLPSNDTQFFGISMGGGLATNPGMASFAASTTGSSATGTDMLYDWFDGSPTGSGLVNSLMPGVLDSLVFWPDAGGGYTWQGL